MGMTRTRSRRSSGSARGATSERLAASGLAAAVGAEPTLICPSPALPWNRINQEFKAFTERVQAQWQQDHTKDLRGLDLAWENTYRKLAFEGVPHKSMCTMIPTDFALVELVEMPFTVITLDEVEVVNLERAALHLRNFDLVLVNKDFTKDVVRIEAVPMKSLETIKEWLNNIGIKYYESKANLNWKQVRGPFGSLRVPSASGPGEPSNRVLPRPAGDQGDPGRPPEVPGGGRLGVPQPRGIRLGGGRRGRRLGVQGRVG